MYVLSIVFVSQFSKDIKYGEYYAMKSIKLVNNLKF